ncbi:MAG: transglutaminase domain-containing protein [Treponema sp.]|uniref:transglutaminase domain-containing protein n=1 Tax=Treponema sp. TaxID=166 RepID=UPI003FA2D4F3
MSSYFSYLVRKYPLVRFLLFFLIIGGILAAVVFLSRFAIRSNTIAAVSPQVTAPGEVITIVGKDFGNQSIHSWLMIGNNKLRSDRCIEWTDTKIIFEAPETLSEDLLSVVAKNRQGNTVMLVNRQLLPINSKNEVNESIPVIDVLDTDSANVGELISIHGKNFGHTRNNSVVLFTGMQNTVHIQTAEQVLTGAECNESDFDYEFWSDRELRIRVPDAADTGNIVVITEAGMSNPAAFRLKNKYGTKTYTDTRTYRLVSEVEISDFIAESPNTLFLRIPIPQKTETQRLVTINSVQPEPFVPSYQGASIYRFYNVDSGTKIQIRQEYSVSRSKVETSVAAGSLKKTGYNNPLLYAAYTEADEFLPANDPAIKKVCKHIIGSETNPYNKAKRIYHFLTSEITARESSAADAGRSILTALEEKTGGAYDLALLFCTLARAAGVPAIPTAGLLVDHNKKAVQHWWAEFYLNGFGWVPVDPALASGIPFDTGAADNKQWYFGNLDAYHIAFSRGYQIQTPMQPNGKTTEKVRSYAFHSIWEETAPTITGYSALWRLPKIAGVY